MAQEVAPELPDEPELLLELGLAVEPLLPVELALAVEPELLVELLLAVLAPLAPAEELLLRLEPLPEELLADPELEELPLAVVDADVLPCVPLPPLDEPTELLAPQEHAELVKSSNSQNAIELRVIGRYPH